MGSTDVFENIYMARFKALLARHGVVLDYDRDRAAIDTGLHIFVESDDTSRTASPVRVWFQAKGRTGAALPLDAFQGAEAVPIVLAVDHLKFWYASAEPVYLAVYIEAADVFLAEDVRDLVDRMWPRGTFYTATADQQTVTVHVPTAAVLDDARLDGMLRHRSMRIDGPAFRGRPLGHRFDPTRSALAEQDPGVWRQLVDDLLGAHDFRVTHTIDVSEHLTIVEGWIHATMSWQSPAFATYGYQDDPREYRHDPPYETIQGAVRIVLDALPERENLSDEEQVLVVSELSAGPITRENLQRRRERFGDDFAFDFLGDSVTDEDESVQMPTSVVWMNAPDLSGTGGLWRSTIRDTDLQGSNRQLGTEATTYLTLTTTLVYLDFAPELRWNHVNYLH